MYGAARPPIRLLMGLLSLAALLFTPASPAGATPQPDVTLATGSAMPGMTFTVTAIFTNGGTSTGYAPFIDLLVPRRGVDGPRDASDPGDGLRVLGAAYLGTPLDIERVLFGSGGGCVNHPFAVDTENRPLEVCGGQAGDALVVIALPFGSFTPGQPPAAIDITLVMDEDADIGVALDLRARGGFRFGADPLNNPCCDVPVLFPASTVATTWPLFPVLPVLLDASKNYLGPADEPDSSFLIPPEPDETVTGPNGPAYPVQYTIAVDIAPGQTLTDFDVTDRLPPDLAFSRIVPDVDKTTPGFTVIDTPGSGAQNPPDNELIVRYASVTGGAGACSPEDFTGCDLLVTVEVFVPYLDAAGSPVLDPATGAFATTQNTFDTGGDWNPTDPRDSDQAVATGGAAAPVLVMRSLALQKSVTPLGGAVLPGGTLEYALEFQVSDFFSFEDVTIDDRLFDGQTFDATFTPVLTLRRSQPSGGPIIEQISLTPQFSQTPNADGSTDITFDISATLTGSGLNPQLVGGCIDPAGGTVTPDCTVVNNGLLNGTLIFRTTVDDTFTTAHTLPGASGDASVDQGDILRNEAVISGDLLDNDTLAPTGQRVSDNSLTTLEVERATPSKTIYAFNGVICPTGGCTGLSVEVGDEVTYRLLYETPSSDFENLVLADFLPLPVYEVDDPDGDGLPGPAWSFERTVNAAPPPAGTVRFGPADTFSTFTTALPAFAPDPPNNTLAFTYGDFDDPANTASTIDLLFTVTITAAPFADGLVLANQLNVTEDSTNAGGNEGNVTATLRVSQPALVTRKGVIAVDNPDAVLTPAVPGPVSFTEPGSSGPRWSGTLNSAGLNGTDIDSDVSGLEPGDRISYAIVVENTGGASRGAFDITIRDTLPPGTVIPPEGANLRAARGDGTAVPFTAIGGGLFDPAGGIELVDPSGTQGACGPFNATSGDNLIVITYDLIVDPNAPRDTLQQNTATVTGFSSREGGENFVDGREGNAYTETATAQVGTGTTGILGQVETLPDTGQSPLSRWRVPLLLSLMAGMLSLGGFVVVLLRRSSMA